VFPTVLIDEANKLKENELAGREGELDKKLSTDWSGFMN
jgi:hypothetical protein